MNIGSNSFVGNNKDADIERLPMAGVFRSWRKIVGLVAMLLASIAMLAWIRTAVISDVIQVCVKSLYRRDQYDIHHIGSFAGRVRWIRLTSVVRMRAFTMNTVPANEVWDDPYKHVPDVTRWQWGGFDFGRGKPMEDSSMVVWSIPYWSIVWPFLLVSLLLLCGRQVRPKSEVASAETRDQSDRIFRIKQGGQGAT